MRRSRRDFCREIGQRQTAESKTRRWWTALARFNGDSHDDGGATVIAFYEVNFG